jgi:hypothetical protein
MARSNRQRTRRLRPLAAVSLAAVAATTMAGGGAFGAGGSATTLTGGTGTAVANGTLYAKSGAPLTLEVTTPSGTKCVRVIDGTTTVETPAPNGGTATSWSIPLAAASGADSVHTLTIQARPGNNNNPCSGQSTAVTPAQSYVVDNTAPQVTPALSPAANGTGWNKSNVSLTWSATDAGSGVDGAPSPATDSVSADTGGVVKQSTATDRVGNVGSAAVTVKLDTANPTITATRSPAANANGWNNGPVTVSLTCADLLSGIKSCTGGGTSVVSTQGAGQAVTATATDNADNSASTTVNNINIDTTAPTLSGAVSGTAGDNGWYTSDVHINWSCADALSGVAACPADSTISGEGEGLKATASASDKAGNSVTAGSPAVRIDKTAPHTDASAVGAWNNTDVTVALTADDAMSGVATTRYRVDGGDPQTGTSVAISEEGQHVLEFWSVDQAGNTETHKTVDVRIDKTSPTIGHTLNPLPNTKGWFKDDVAVHFVCNDALSQIASCGPDRVVSKEGANQDASGTAVDNAGNSAVDPLTISLDRTPPTITASADREPNAVGWYADDVTVSFACGDALSGVDHCPGAQRLGEGAAQTASGTASDAAGNTAHDAATGIDVDKTNPVLSGHATTQPNDNGWYLDDVKVAWECSDALSGVSGPCPADATVGGEGGNLSTSASIADKAGNRADATVDHIRIDRSAPTTTANVPAPLESGWYAGAVKVTLDAADALSGVDTTYYRLDDGDAHAYDGAFDVSAKGTHTVTFWSVDRAGNTEDRETPGHAVTLKIDDIAPHITGHRMPAANGFGWNNDEVTVTFDCSDDESGIAGCSEPSTLSNEGAGQSVVGNAKDNAGNTSSAAVDDINIDKTVPSLHGAATTDPNAAGWYNDDVRIHWTADDGLSGIDPATLPADSVINGEGANLGTDPVQVADKAGNAQSDSVSGIKIDRAAPTITGAPTTAPNADGWYGGDVVVAFACTDELSGVASCPSDKLVSGNGADQSVTSDTATDLAGNRRAGVTVGGLNIDGLAPQTTADNRCTKTNGYCTGSTGTVVLSSTDQSGLSGVKEIHYRVNDGIEQVEPGATATVDVPLNGSGEATVTFYAVDRAGNREATNGVALKYDNIAPFVTHSLDPSPNANEWNRSDVTVHFDAKDNDGGSGVDASRTTPDVTVGDETAGHVVRGEAYDIAGNHGTDAVTVRLDRTAPAISGAVVSGTRGENGWYTGPVQVHFTCSDDLSHVAVCPDDVTFTNDGKGQSVTREAVDFAGNRASVTVGGIDIDHERPSIVMGGVTDGAIYTLGAVPTPSCTAKDDVSGPADCSVTVRGGQPNGVGTFTYEAVAKDKAGNTTKLSGAYRVIYRFDGFLQPINDTAHQVGVTTSVFKAGSTVPVKLQLKNAGGSTVQAGSAPVWETPAKGGPTTAPPDEALYGVVADSASAYRWDASARQYIYNWGTDAAAKGYYYRIGVRLDDGQSYVVNIGLR